MIDPAWLRDNVEIVRTSVRNRGADLSRELDTLLELESRRRRLLPQIEGLKREQNAAAEEIGRAKRSGADTSALQEATRDRAASIKRFDAELQELETQRQALLLVMPNPPHATVPVGASAADNVEVRRHGTPKTFAFTPQAHWDLGPALGIIDFERGTKIAAARFSVLIGAGARLARALTNFMLHLHTTEHGYTEVEPPFMANTASLTGTGNLPKFEADLFKIAGDWDLYLVPTAEVPLTNMHRGEILDARQLPVRYTAYTPCFRSEAGSYGTDVRGLIRQHQFDKVELMAFTAPDASHAELERLTSNAEEVLRRLGLPFRTMLLCTGDMGFQSAKTYDIEVWLPGQDTYREISSCSNTESFQARRAGIRFKPQGGKTDFVHTLNGSGLAVGRTLVAVLENYQQEDGSVVIPEALRPFMDGQDVIRPKTGGF
jgi:seryl-tRNA synthetase